MIVKATYLAIKDLLDEIKDGDEIHSPKINAGLFATPWEWTEKAIEQALSETNKKVKWIVWEYEE